MSSSKPAYFTMNFEVAYLSKQLLIDRSIHQLIHWLVVRMLASIVGIYIINLKKTWEKLLFAARAIAAIENPADVCVISARPYGQRAVLKFASHTGATPIAGRFTPGTFTNQIQVWYFVVLLFCIILLASFWCLFSATSHQSSQTRQKIGWMGWQFM